MNKLFKVDWIILVCTMILIGIGLFTLYSLTLTQSTSVFFRTEFTNQLVFTLVGAVFAIIIFVIPPIYFQFKPVIYAVFVVSLIALLFVLFFAPDVKGVKRWIMIGDSITIQPSEFIKMSIILISAAFFSYSRQATRTGNKLLYFILQNKYIFLGLSTSIILISLVIVQPSLSVALVLLFVLCAVFFASIENKQFVFLVIVCIVLSLLVSQTLFFQFHIITRIVVFMFLLGIYAFSVFSNKIPEYAIFLAIASGIVIGALVMPFVWNNILHDYQRERVEAFVNARNQTRDEQVEGFQQEQAKVSIGSGQFFGQGFKPISDVRLQSQPEATTDFIFAIFSLKFGFIGASIIIFLYLVLVLRFFYIADAMNDQFSSLVLIGIGTLILVQFFSNIGMNLDILPVGGSTLPFMSAGGSSLLSMMIAVAVGENIIATNALEKNNYRKSDKVQINGWNI